MHGSVQAVCKCFFGDGGKGALSAGKTGVAPPFSQLPQGRRSKRWALPIRKPRGTFSFKRECPPPAPLKRNVGTPPYTVTAIRFPALPGRQSCRFLESGPLYPPQAALGPLSPHPLLAQRGGLRPSPLETPPGQGGARYRLPCRPQTHLPAAPKDVPHRIAFPHLGARCSPGCK